MTLRGKRKNQGATQKIKPIRNDLKPKDFQIDGEVTGLQIGCGVRVCKLLILLGGFCGVHPTPGVLAKEFVFI